MSRRVYLVLAAAVLIVAVSAGAAFAQEAAPLPPARRPARVAWVVVGPADRVPATVPGTLESLPLPIFLTIQSSEEVRALAAIWDDGLEHRYSIDWVGLTGSSKETVLKPVQSRDGLVFLTDSAVLSAGDYRVAVAVDGIEVCRTPLTIVLAAVPESTASGSPGSGAGQTAPPDAGKVVVTTGFDLGPGRIPFNVVSAKQFSVSYYNFIYAYARFADDQKEHSWEARWFDLADGSAVRYCKDPPVVKDGYVHLFVALELKAPWADREALGPGDYAVVVYRDGLAVGSAAFTLVK